MYEVKAIETEYNGYLFRSRTEARWAVFFDYVGEPYEYEKECFQLPSGKYLPDFFLPRHDLWIEIKGKEPTENEWNKCEELFNLTDAPVACLWGTPGKREGRLFCNGETASGGGGAARFDVVVPIIRYGCLEFIVADDAGRGLYDGKWEPLGLILCCYPEFHYFWRNIVLQKDIELYNEAVAYSRKARFEKGVKVPRGRK